MRLRRRANSGAAALQTAAELAALGTVVAHNWATNRVLPRWSYVPVNLAVSGSLVALARARGASWDALGLSPSGVPRGVRAGLAASGALVATVAAGLAWPVTRRWFADDRAVLQGNPAATYDASVRIPLGTALSEEVTFRSALLAIGARRYGTPTSVAVTSALFGLWHLLPTLHTLPLNTALTEAEARSSATGVLAGSVVMTGLAGAALALLRLRSRSVIAPVMAHAALNVSAFVGARLVHRRTRPAT